ncbi:hypothetical protein ACH4E7_28460 [Kitasatospora sp. NPDC018058]|uniref:hypothetical protein n=1 Tax=Kitasatospora sp. NPDC018058 TaxID=3364025 RepID=UPI0037C124CA
MPSRTEILKADLMDTATSVPQLAEHFGGGVVKSVVAGPRGCARLAKLDFQAARRDLGEVGFERGFAFDGISDVVARCWSVVLRAGWAAGAWGARGKWW